MTSVIDEGTAGDIIFLTFNTFTHKILIEDLLKNEQTVRIKNCLNVQDQRIVASVAKLS